MNEHTNLNVTNPSDDVPAFTCVVYVRTADAKTFARVANLAGIEAVGSSERDVLGKIIPAFKKRVAEKLAAGDQIHWIEPPHPAQQGEQKRIVPVHL